MSVSALVLFCSTVCANCCSSVFGETKLSAGENVKSNLKSILKEHGLQQVVVLFIVKGHVPMFLNESSVEWNKFLDTFYILEKNLHVMVYEVDTESTSCYSETSM